jgi:DNA-binding response OmpR family regulator
MSFTGVDRHALSWTLSPFLADESLKPLMRCPAVDVPRATSARPRSRPDPFTSTSGRADEPPTTETRLALATEPADNPSQCDTTRDARNGCEPVRLRESDRVLVVDDDAVISGLVRDSLEREGFVVQEAADGASALDLLAKQSAHLVILDVNLPARGGFEVLSAIRASWAIPVIMLTGRVSEIDRVLGLELGADDYVAKPFSPRELAARVRAVLRRSTSPPNHDLDFGDLKINVATREVHLRGDTVDLTAREFDLLAFLAGSPREVFSHAQLLAQVWHSTSGWQDPATITEHVRRIRAKIEQDRTHPRWIRTVRAAGYAFEP